MDTFSEIRMVGTLLCSKDNLVMNVDYSGVETLAVVEFAPHPKIPSDKKKADVRSGTIEKGAISYDTLFHIPQDALLA